MIQELNREYPELDDPKIFEKMVNLTVAQMKYIDNQRRRGQHAKATGCLHAEFSVSDDVPTDLQHGVFRELRRTFKAIVRFSNSQPTFEKDGEGTGRGLAIKLLAVEGKRAVADDGDGTQDFLLINHPVFPFPDPKAYVETISRRSIPWIGPIVALVHLAVFKRQQLKIINTIRKEHVASALEIKYWSGTPYWLGPIAGAGSRGQVLGCTSPGRSHAPTGSS